jgi:carboxyl-terminal processing protease
MRPARLIAILAALFLAQPCFADESMQSLVTQASKNLNTALRQMTISRNKASAIGKQEPVSTYGRESGQEYLRLANELEAAGVSGLISDATGLRSKILDLRMDGAIRFAKAGDKASVLATFDTIYQTEIMDFTDFLALPEFAKWKDDPEFQAMAKRSQRAAAMGKKSVIGSAYSDTLSDAEKVAGLSLFWSEARRSFVHFANTPQLDWDQAYLDFLPKVLAAKDVREYYRVMMQLAPLLRDGHTNIYPPEQLTQEFYARPAITTALVEGRVLVTRVGNSSLQQRITVGDEVTAIDGIAVHDYARDKVAPFVSSSTVQDRQVRMYSYQLLSGDKSKPVTLTLRNAAGALRTEQLQRGHEQDVPRKRFEFKILPGDIAYIALDHFESNAGVKAFEEALPAIMKAKALIIDVRENGGGSSNFGLEVLSYLAKGPIATALSLERSESQYFRAQVDMLNLAPLPYIRPRPFVRERAAYFTGKVAVLAGPRSFSAAEDFLMSFDTMQRGVIVGEASAGSTGQPLFMRLPGGGSGRLCVKYDIYPDGKRFVGVGIQPQIASAPTVADIRARRDTVLERALVALAN